MDELMPCPFCGGKAEVLYTGKYECFVRCRRGCVEQTKLYKAKSSALKAWNRRRLSAQPEIIRCKDCKHYEIVRLTKSGEDDKRCKPSVCIKGKYAEGRNRDWFCADAERRTDG